jgi:hypothetical protein
MNPNVPGSTSPRPSIHTNFTIAGHRPTNGTSPSQSKTGIYTGQITDPAIVEKQSPTLKTKALANLLLAQHRISDNNLSPRAGVSQALSDQKTLSNKDNQTEPSNVNWVQGKLLKKRSISPPPPLTRSATDADLRQSLLQEQEITSGTSASPSKSYIEEAKVHSFAMTTASTHEVGPPIILARTRSNVTQPPDTVQQNILGRELYEKTKIRSGSLESNPDQTIGRQVDNIVKEAIQNGEIASLNGVYNSVKKTNISSSDYLDRIILTYSNLSAKDISSKPGTIGVKPTSVANNHDLVKIRALHIAKSFTWSEQDKISSTYTPSAEITTRLDKLIKLGLSSESLNVKEEAKKLQDEYTTLTKKVKTFAEKKEQCQKLYGHLLSTSGQDNSKDILRTLALLMTPKNSETTPGDYQKKLAEKETELTNVMKNSPNIMEHSSRSAVRMAHGFLALAGKWSPPVMDKVDLTQISSKGNPINISLNELSYQLAARLDNRYQQGINSMAQSWDAVIKGVFSKIQLSEFHRQNWLNPQEKNDLAPNLAALGDLFNIASQYYMDAILSVETPNEQARMITIVIETAFTLLNQRNNLFGCQALLGIFADPRIDKCPGMQSVLQQKELNKKLETMKDLVNPNENLKNLRKEHSNFLLKTLQSERASTSSDAFVPAINVYQKDLIMSAEVPSANLTYKIGGMIQDIGQFITNIARNPPAPPSTDIVLQAIRHNSSSK